MKAGITGHQQLGSETVIAWISNRLSSIINEYHIDMGITSLATGADQLYAEVLRKAHIPYIALIPCADYETTFQSVHALERYQELLRNASEELQLPFDKPGETAYYEAGKQIVQLSDILIAIWNGLPAKGLGGTGDIVRYAILNKKQVIHINPITQKVSLIFVK